jgi:hypothetical protein
MSPFKPQHLCHQRQQEEDVSQFVLESNCCNTSCFWKHDKVAANTQHTPEEVRQTTKTVPVNYAPACSCKAILALVGSVRPHTSTLVSRGGVSHLRQVLCYPTTCDPNHAGPRTTPVCTGTPAANQDATGNNCSPPHPCSSPSKHTRTTSTL